MPYPPLAVMRQGRAAAGPHAPNSSHVVVIPVRKLRGRAVVDVEHEVELLVIERLRVLFVLEA